MRILALLGVLWVAPAAMAVTTSTWTYGAGAADGFDTGDMQEVVVGSHGDLRLSRNTKTLLKDDPRLEVIHSLLQLPDGTTLLGTGPEGTILRRSKAGEVAPLYQAGADTLVTAMQLLPDGRLLAGISGKSARLVQIDPRTGAAKDLWTAEDMQFIWSILPRPDGSVLLGTGPTGKLLELSREGAIRVVFTSKQPNLVRLLADKGDDVIIGTEPEALVLRVNAKTGQWFVLYDADEAEVAALARDQEGNLYVATTSAAPVGKGAAPAGGRPQVSPEIPLHREPPTTPQPPALPEPNPGEPEPIPKAAPVSPQHMRALESDVEEGDAAAPQTQPTKAPSQAPTAEASTDEGASSSTAVYRITPAGFVAELLRRPGTAYSMIWSGRSLLLGTGPKGEVVEYRPGDEELATLWKSDSRQVSAMALLPDGSVLLGLSNPGMLVQMDGGYAAKGTFLSEVLDASQVARFGKVQLQGTLPAKTGVTLATRSGNTTDPDEGGWSNWSEETPAAEFIQVASPSARFLQYRLTLTTQDQASTPTIEQAKVSYLVPNLAPKVTSVVVEPAKAEGDSDTEPTTSPATYTIKWEASDTNNDRLVYSLHYRLGHQGKWVLLKDKLTDTSYTWETRKLADGRYQVRVTASDERSNAAGEGKTGERYSDTVIIDNTPPAIGDLRTAQTADGAEVSLRVVDRTGTVARVEYAIDAGDDWQAVNASDMLYDSPDETVKFAVSKLAPGPHQVSVRAADAAGNTAYETLIITVPDRK